MMRLIRSRNELWEGRLQALPRGCRTHDRISGIRAVEMLSGVTVGEGVEVEGESVCDRERSIGTVRLLRDGIFMAGNGC